MHMPALSSHLQMLREKNAGVGALPQPAALEQAVCGGEVGLGLKKKQTQKTGRNSDKWSQSTVISVCHGDDTWCGGATRITEAAAEPRALRLLQQWHSSGTEPNRQVGRGKTSPKRSLRELPQTALLFSLLCK